jgi:hypothetical protein
MLRFRVRVLSSRVSSSQRTQFQYTHYHHLTSFARLCRSLNRLRALAFPTPKFYIRSFYLAFPSVSLSSGIYIFRTTDLRLLPLTTTSFASIFFRASERTLSSHRSYVERTLSSHRPYVERIRIDLTSIFSTSARWISTGWPSRASGSSMARTIRTGRSK